MDVTNETDTTRSELGYTNALRLTGSLIHLVHRAYDAEAKVFVQSDVVDRLRYTYTGGDPINRSDPTGLMWAISTADMGGARFWDGGNPKAEASGFSADQKGSAREAKSRVRSVAASLESAGQDKWKLGLTIETDRGAIKAEVSIEGDSNYAQKVASDLVEAASTDTGAEMMKELVDSGRTLTIGMPTQPDRAYTNKVGAAGPPGVGSDVRISYNPEGNYSYLTTGGDIAMTAREYAAMPPLTEQGIAFVSPAVVLGHELAHAAALAQGTVMSGTVPWQTTPRLNDRGEHIRLDEVFATSRGNRLAREMGMPELVDERVF